MKHTACLFEFSNEYDEVKSLIKSLAIGELSESTLTRTSSMVLETIIHGALDRRLDKAFAVKNDTILTVTDLIEDMANESLNRRDVDAVAEFIMTMTDDVEDIILNSLCDVETAFAIWNVRSISYRVYAVEYEGDYRILEWHSRNGTPYNSGHKVSYEFQLGFLFNHLYDNISRVAGIGRSGGAYLRRKVAGFMSCIIEESLFSERASEMVIGTGIDTEPDQKWFKNTKRMLLDHIPTLSGEDIDTIIYDAEAVIAPELKAIVDRAVDSGEIETWGIMNKVLTVTVKRNPKSMDHVEMFKSDLEASVSNGDWIPPSQRVLLTII